MTSVLYSAGLNYQASNPLRLENNRIRAYLADLRRQGRLRGFLPGERFGPADAEAIALVAAFPELRNLHDWSASNPGISIVVI